MDIQVFSDSISPDINTSPHTQSKSLSFTNILAKANDDEWQ